MIKTKVNCAVCQTIKAQPKGTGGRLAKRIYGSRYFAPSSSYSLADIAREYSDKFGYESLLNHVKKHQALTEDDFNERHLRELAVKAEKSLLKDAITSQNVWDGVIKKGMDKLAKGKLEVTTAHLLGAARDKSNYELKQTGQQMAFMEMLWGFTSGESLPQGVRKDEHDGAIEGEVVSAGTGEVTEGREARSRAFYQSLAGDASPPGAD